MGILDSFGKMIGVFSGETTMKVSEQLLFDKVIGFRSVVPGTGASTFLQNVAVALSENTNYNICVIDLNFLYPWQYNFFMTYDDAKRLDLLEFNNDLSLVTHTTQYKNVYLGYLNDRTIVDLLSSIKGASPRMDIIRLLEFIKLFS